MQAKHTPGPWHAVTIGTIHLISQDSDPDGRFALARSFFPDYHPDGLLAARHEQDANTRLIAAAPELLDALEYIIGWTPENWSSETARDLACAAIAKAKGE